MQELFRKEEIAVEYAYSNIAIVSSLYEGFGFPVGEAMACSIPLIATNVASIPEITSSFAELIPEKDPHSIEQAIRKIFLNPSKYQIRADAGRMHIIEKFDWKKIEKSLSLIIEKIIVRSEQKNQDTLKRWSLMKNPQFFSNSHETENYCLMR